MKESSILDAIFLTDNIKLYVFSTLPELIRCRLSSTRCQTSTNNNYFSWSYNTMVNLATKKHDLRVVVYKGLTASNNKLSGLNLRGVYDKLHLLDSIDSKEMIKY